MRRLTMLLVALATIAASLTAFTAPAQAADRDCGDFPNQAAAQNFYLANGGPGSDPHGLDADGDGRACDSNPCPCSSGKKPPKPGPATPPPPPILRQWARIIRVIDGDTVEARLATGRKVDVRILGIDTPEVHGGEECFGPEASKRTKKILPRRTRVLLVSDRTQDLQDRYGRLLRYVQKGKVDVGRNLVKTGHAEVYVFRKPFVRARAYKGEQAKAKRAGRGMWGAC